MAEIEIHNNTLSGQEVSLNLTDIRAFEVKETVLRQICFIAPTVIAGLVFVLLAPALVALEFLPANELTISGVLLMLLLSAGIAVLAWVSSAIPAIAYAFFFLPRCLKIYTEFGRIDLSVKDLNLPQLLPEMTAQIEGRSQYRT